MKTQSERIRADLNAWIDRYQSAIRDYYAFADGCVQRVLEFLKARLSESGYGPLKTHSLLCVLDSQVTPHVSDRVFRCLRDCEVCEVIFDPQASRFYVFGHKKNNSREAAS